jgi:hypothetical protein
MALLPVLAKSRPATNPPAGRDTTICQLNFQLGRYDSALTRSSLVMTHCFPRLSYVRHDKSRPVGSDNGGSGRFAVFQDRLARD